MGPRKQGIYRVNLIHLRLVTLVLLPLFHFSLAMSNHIYNVSETRSVPGIFPTQAVVTVIQNYLASHGWRVKDLTPTSLRATKQGLHVNFKPKMTVIVYQDTANARTVVQIKSYAAIKIMTYARLLAQVPASTFCSLLLWFQWHFCWILDSWSICMCWSDPLYASQRRGTTLVPSPSPSPSVTHPCVCFSSSFLQAMSFVHRIFDQLQTLVAGPQTLLQRKGFAGRSRTPRIPKAAVVVPNAPAVQVVAPQPQQQVLPAFGVAVPRSKPLPAPAPQPVNFAPQSIQVQPLTLDCQDMFVITPAPVVAAAV